MIVEVRTSAVLAALAVGCAASVRPLAGYADVSPHPWSALALWALSVALAMWAMRAMMAAPGAAAPETSWRRRWPDASLALAIFALALACRSVALTSRPLLGGDEASFAAFARALWSTGGNPLGLGWDSWPALSQYAAAMAFVFDGPPVVLSRAPMVVIGSLTAALVYLAGARAAGRYAGLCAGVMLAMLVLHVHLSRQGMHIAWDGLWSLVTLAALEQGWRQRDRAGFLVAGAALALSTNFYAGSRVLPLVVAAFVALRVVTEGSGVRERWRDVAAMAFVAVVGAWPQVTLALAQPQRWLAPVMRQALPLTDASGAVAEAALALQRVLDAALALVATDMRGHFSPPAPMLPPLFAALFVAGVFVLARRWREPWAQLAALWIASAIGLAAASTPSPSGHRYMFAMPAVVLVAGAGAAAIVHLVARFLARRGRRSAMAAAVLLFAAIATQGAISLDHYLYRSPPWVGALRDVNSEIAVDLAARIGAAAPGTRVVMIGAPRMWYRGFAQLRYLHPLTVARDVEGSEDAVAATREGCRAAQRPAADVVPPTHTTATVAAVAVDCLVALLPHRADLRAQLAANIVVISATDVRAADGLPLYTLLAACGNCAAPASASVAGSGGIAAAAAAPTISSIR